MIDIHCHILPNSDDGARSFEEATLMAAISADDGVTDIIATPHVTFGENISEKMLAFRRRADELRSRLAASGIPITLHVGSELLCRGDIPRSLTIDELPLIADTCHTLVEFDFDASSESIVGWTDVIRAVGCRPIIAHPERYRAFQRDRALASELCRGGVLIQINKGSLVGGFGRRAMRCAHRIIAEGIATFVASDAHDSRNRTPSMSAVMSALTERYGGVVAMELTETNQRKMLEITNERV